MKQHKKKLFVLLLTFCMAFTMMPTFAFASAEAEPAEETAVEETTAPEQTAPEQATDVEAPAESEDVQAPSAEADATDKSAEPAEKDAENNDDSEEAKAKDEKDLEVKEQALPSKGKDLSYTSSGKPVVFKIKHDGHTYRGGCANLGVASKASGKAEVKYTYKNSTAKIAKLVYYYGYIKGWYTSAHSKDKATKVLGFSDSSCKETAKQCITALLQRHVAGSDSAFLAKYIVNNHRMYSSKKFMEEICKLYKNFKPDKHSYRSGDNFEMMYMVSEKGYQNFYVWRKWGTPDAYLKIEKAGANPDISNRSHEEINTDEIDFEDEEGTEDTSSGGDEAEDVNTGGDDEEAGDDNAMYSLANAKYQVYTDAACTVKAKDANGKNALFITDVNGDSNVLKLEKGKTYYIKETEPSSGFRIESVDGSAKVHKITMKDSDKDDPDVIESFEPEAYGIPEFMIYKQSEFGDDVDASGLLGAGFMISYYDVKDMKDIEGAEPAAAWAFTTKEKTPPADHTDDNTFWAGFDWRTDDALDGSSRFYLDPEDDETRVMPLGWFTIKEVKAPSGYSLTSDMIYGHVYQPSKGAQAEVEYFDQDGKKLSHAYMEAARIKDAPMPATINKVDSVTGKPVAGAQLEILSGSTVVVAPWTTTEEPKEITGLAPGTYTLHEVAAPYGYDTADDVTFKLTGEGNESITMKNTPVTVKTTAVDGETGMKQGVKKAGSEIIDTVQLTGLVKGRKYVVNGKLWDKMANDFVKEDGKVVVSAPEEFTATSEAMTVTITFTVDTSSFPNDADIVAYEYLSRAAAIAQEDAKDFPKELAKHEDPNDEGQTVHYGGIAHTVAVDAESKSHNVLAADNRKVIDTVSYESLIAGQKYLLEGEWYDATADKMTGITASKEFVPEAADGKVDVEFEFDASAYEGHKLVCFETLSVIPKDKDGKDEEPVPVDKHEDPKDEDETIYIPEIRTTLADTETKDHHSMAKKDITVKDTVKFRNLIPGKEYTFTGKLVYKDNGNDVINDGKTVTASTKYTPDSPDGEVELTFTFNGVGLEGRTVVAYENVYEEDVLVAIHADINDEDQSDHIPKIGTKASDIETKDHISAFGDHVTITDKVSYQNLIPGKEYVMTGKPVLKSTGEVIKDEYGKEVSASVKFKPEKPDGEVELTFSVYRAAITGDTVVAFEDLYYNDVQIATHSDLEDEEQSVHIPEIGTTATDSDTEDHISYGDKRVTIYDVVTFSNLIPGKEYTLTGTLFDKDTDDPIKVDGHNVTAETKFTPDSADGEAIVEFNFDGSSLRGKKVVAFEDLYYNDVLVAAHADINDEDQLVTIPVIGTKVGKPDGKRVKDIVAFKGLLEDREYIVRGWLVDKDTKEKIPGSDNSVRFTPEEAKGAVEVSLKYAGHKGTMVAFEEIYIVDENGEETIIADHKDINDNDQTFSIKTPVPKTGERETVLWLSIGFSLASLAIVSFLIATRRKEKSSR